MIHVAMLGTGALLPQPERALTSVFLTCKGHGILFDCGEGTQSAARKAGVSLMKTDLIALTHYHGDHIFGLPGLIQTMCMMGRKEPLTITGPGAIRDELAPILKLIGWIDFEIRLLSLPAEGIRLSEHFPGFPCEARLEAFPTLHSVPSQGYVFTLSRAGKFQPDKAEALSIPKFKWSLLQNGESIEVNGRTILPEEVLGPERKGLRVVFSGDTMPCEKLREAAKGADLFICEATYGMDSQEKLAKEHAHSTFSQAARLAAAAGTKRLWLTHFSQMILDPEEYLPFARAEYPETVCTKDGMSAELAFDEV